MTFVRRKPLVSFFVLAYGLSWAYWIPLALAGVRTAPGSSTTHEPGLLGPALAAFIITGLTEGRAGVVAFAKRLVLVSRPTSRFLIYSLSPPMFLGLAIVVGNALSCGGFSAPAEGTGSDQRLYHSSRVRLGPITRA